MAEPFIAEIRLFSFPFAPQGWATCDGQTLNIVQNQALFALIGSTFGGDGKTTFKLPDLRGCVPVPPNGSTVTNGQRSGEEQHVLTVNETPIHTHQVLADDADATIVTPAFPPDAFTWAAASQNPFAPAPPDCILHPSAITVVGGGQGHSNMQPYLAVNFCIALMGYWPPRD